MMTPLEKQIKALEELRKNIIGELKETEGSEHNFKDVEKAFDGVISGLIILQDEGKGDVEKLRKNIIGELSKIKASRRDLRETGKAFNKAISYLRGPHGAGWGEEIDKKR